MADHRDEIESRINSFIAGWLDGAIEIYGDDFQVGAFALVFEMNFPPEEDAPQGSSEIGWSSSDGRSWIQAGLFRRALISVEAQYLESNSD